MGFRVLDNSDINDINDNINDLTKFKESFIKKFEDSKEAEIEYKKAVKLYKKTTKNTDLIMNLNQIFLSKERNELTEKDLPYIIKSEVKAIKNIAENLTIKNSIKKEKQKNIVENEQKIKHVNKNVL